VEEDLARQSLAVEQVTTGLEPSRSDVPCTPSEPQPLSASANAQVDPGPGIKAGFVEDVVDHCSAAMVLDSSRRRFVCENACTMFYLIRGCLINDTRFRRTLLGRKGVGKTLLLTAFANAVQTIPFANKVIVVHLNCARTKELPKSALCRRLQVSPDLDWDQVDAEVISREPKVLFLVDEFNLVFHRDFERGREYIADIQAIGEDIQGLYHCILSGSSSVLQKLITAKLSAQEAEDNCLANYSHLDLNESKFDPRTIVPFTCQTDLDNLIEYCRKKYGDVSGNIDLDSLVVETGGLPGVIQEYCRTGLFSSNK
jgi:hypothetical protein